MMTDTDIQGKMTRNIVGNFIVNSIQEVTHLTARTIMYLFMHLVETKHKGD